jgi:hypothetical protein
MRLSSWRTHWSGRHRSYVAGFKGILQVDGYAGYGKLAERGDAQLAFC